MSHFVHTVEDCVDRVLVEVGSTIVLGAPLGLGKPVQLINAFYRRAEANPDLSLHIVTALSLEVPRPSAGVEARLAGPIMQRLFGDYEELAYLAPFREGKLPPNIKVSELYFRAGSMKNVPAAQQNYISSNYTHIARDMAALGMNVMAQMVAAREGDDGLSLSLSCNTDLTLEMLDARREEGGRRPLLLAQVHDALPFMTLDAELPAAEFDYIVRNDAYNRTLFAVPNGAVPLQDYATALHASSLVVDGGTLQIGIGSLGDAVAHACLLRQRDNGSYQDMLAALRTVQDNDKGATGSFEQGLYVCTEMFVNGMMHLIEAGVVRRPVYDNLHLQRGLNSGAIGHEIDQRLYAYGRDCGLIPRQLDAQALALLQHWGILPPGLALSDPGLRLAGNELANDLDDPATREALLQAVAGTTLRNGRILHGGFFLGPRDFYRKLRELDDELRERICMTGVRRTNQLLLDVPLYSAQRRHARFINTGMMVTLCGAVASDALEDGTVISGVGGQYNFVAMAHDLPGARSILCIRSTRGQGDDLRSNIVPNYGYTTIPKHLRDIVVTEYGIADLRGQSDAEVIRRLVNIADSRFQEELLGFARKHHKIPSSYRVPEHARHNTPERLQAALEAYRSSGALPDYPFGTELTEQERALAASLRHIKSLSEEPAHFITQSFRALLHHPDAAAAQPFLERLQLQHPQTTRDFLIQQLLLLDLEERGLLKAG